MATHTFEFTSGNYGVRFIITQTPNESNNTSTITLTDLYIKAPGQTVILDGQLWINGQKLWYANVYQGTHVQWVSGWTQEDVGSTGTTITVPHNDDGSLTITASLYEEYYTSSNRFYITDQNGNGLAYWANGTSQSITGTANNVGKVRIYTSSGWVSATPYVYTSSGWKKAIPYVYTSSGWTKAK